MDRRLYKELWSLRFQKMLQLEKKSITDYQALIADCRRNTLSSSVIPPVKKLIAEEKRHVILVQELMKILKKQKD